MGAVWKEQAKTLTELLELERKPVAVTFTNDPFEAEGKMLGRLCALMKQASRGKSYVVTKENSGCPGGSWHCGLVEAPSGDTWRIIQHFLTRGEKITHSLVSFERMMQLTASPPTGMADRILIGPVEEAEVRPDIVLFLCNAGQGSRIVTLDHYWDRIPPQVEISGSLCHSAIAYPVVTGRTNVTLGDWTARRMTKYDDDVVFVSVPQERMHNLVEAIPLCTAGTAEMEMPPGVEEQMREGEE